MDNIINALVKDLSMYPPHDIQLLARYYNVSVDLSIIAEHNLGYKYMARMYGKTYHTDQLGDVINILNSRLKSNICLSSALVVTQYTDKPGVDYYSTMHLNIKHQKYDIYDSDAVRITGTTDAPFPMLDEILGMEANRYCFFVLWVKKDGTKPDLPVLETHLTLVLCERASSDKSYKVYKYNSGFSDEIVEQLLDSSIINFFNLIQSRNFDIVPTHTWCPKNIQGTSNLCTIFVFNIYYNLNKYRGLSIEEIIEYKLQEMTNIIPFLQDLSKDLPGTGEHEISLG